MGVGVGISSSFYDTNQDLPNPDPMHYTIVESYETEGIVILIVHYPNAKNYEGRKILVIEGSTVQELKNLKALDPHFYPDAPYKLLARFAPTDEGKRQAILFVEAYKTYRLDKE